MEKEVQFFYIQKIQISIFSVKWEFELRAQQNFLSIICNIACSIFSLI